MKTVCQLHECTGCKACVNICPHNAICVVDTMKSMDAVIDEDICVDCGLCAQVCPNNTAVQRRKPLSWNQGWAEDDTVRMRGSSGGVASAMIESFIQSGGYVCSCLFDEGAFRFKCTKDLEQAQRFAGSKYVKSDPGEIYKEVKRLLTESEKLLFIGLPCQVAALYNFIPEKLQGKLYTADLICHGTPSAKLFELYLNQNGVRQADAADIRFRHKAVMGLRYNGKALSALGTVDRWLLSFLNAMNYTDHCYNCQYAAPERVADLTLGDNWGTEMKSQMSKGVSLILAQTEKGEELLRLAKLTLHEADQETALTSNGNLHHPSVAPQNREAFFAQLDKGANYNKLVMKYLPKQCMRQNIKGIAVKLGLRKPRK